MLPLTLFGLYKKPIFIGTQAIQLGKMPKSGLVSLVRLREKPLQLLLIHLRLILLQLMFVSIVDCLLQAFWTLRLRLHVLAIKEKMQSQERLALRIRQVNYGLAESWGRIMMQVRRQTDLHCWMEQMELTWRKSLLVLEQLAQA